MLLIAAVILAPGKRSTRGGKQVPATVSAISYAIRWAEELMDEIDRRWSVKEAPYRDERRSSPALLESL